MLLTKTYPLAGLQTALADLSSGDELKVGVKPN
jgi:hypothetical protein